MLIGGKIRENNWDNMGEKMEKMWVIRDDER